MPYISTKCVTSDSQSIPKIIHQIWLGKELPSNFKHLAASWQTLHPEWEYRLWTDADIDTFSFKTGDLFHKVKNPGMRSDILRYEILYKMGGLYVDTDFEALRSFEPFHHSDPFYTGCYLSEKQVYNALIGSAPKHGLLEEILASLSSIGKIEQETNDYVVKTTGPIMFTQHVMKYLDRHPSSIKIYPEEFFYPIHCRFAPDMENLGFSLPKWMKRLLALRSYAIHYYASYWKKPEAFTPKSKT